MEWEKKFYDIIQETETNLAKARLKLQGKSLSANDSNRHLDHLGTAQLSSSFAHPLSSTHWDSTSRGTLALGRSLPGSLLPSGKHDASLHTKPTSEMGELLSKIDSQNLMIDRLERLVRTLNQEKDQYRRHITDLQHEVGDITTKMNENRFMNPHLETQVDLMRHEVRSDMHRLQNMISAAQNSSLHSNGLERSFKDMQHSVHAELEGIRRDLNVMTHRVGRLELDVSSHNVSQRDLHDRLNASLLTSSPTGQLGQSSHSLGNQSSPWNRGDVSHLKDLRSTVSELYAKLDSLEGRLAAGSSVPTVQSPRLVRGLGRYSKLYKPSKLTLSCCGDDDDDDTDLDELDLSDLQLSSSDDDASNNDLSDDLDEIINARKMSPAKARSPAGIAGLLSQQRDARGTLADLNLSSDDQANGSSDGADLSDLDLDNLDLSSGGSSVDLGSLGGGSVDLKLDDL